MLKNVAQLVHTRHRSVHNFLINLLAAMGRTASSSPSQQSTSTTRCRTQTVDSPFGNSSNLIFSKAHQAATFMVARHLVCIRITPFQSTLIPNSHYMVDSPCVPSRPPFFIGIILRLMFVAGGTFPPATAYCFLKVGNAPLSS